MYMHQINNTRRQFLSIYSRLRVSVLNAILRHDLMNTDRANGKKEYRPIKNKMKKTRSTESK